MSIETDLDGRLNGVRGWLLLFYVVMGVGLPTVAFLGAQRPPNNEYLDPSRQVTRQ
jgi:hypothetical protein